MRTVGYTTKVEIAPDRWLPVRGGDTVPATDLESNRKNPHELSPFGALKQFLGSGSSVGAGAERSSLAFAWNGKPVTWRGREIPVTLREHDGTLFMIGFNRTDMQRMRFVYFQLNKAGTGFHKIESQNFPKQIATQNMWLGSGWRFVVVGSERVDRWMELRQLDIESAYFDCSITAHIWYQLVKDVERYEMPYLIPRDFLHDYVAQYRPIALPTLVQEGPGSAPAAAAEQPDAGETTP